MKTALIVGHSHIRCMMAAQASVARPGVEFIDILTHGEANKKLPADNFGPFIKKLAKTKTPDVICLCIFGNYHNVLGLMEHPTPFSVGSPVSGAAPPDTDRWFLPSALVQDLYKQRFSRGARMIDSIYRAFPKSSRVYLNPPPPISDLAHVTNIPVALSDLIHMGAAPSALRMRLYELQTAYFAELAKHHKAHFILPDPKALTAEGFLALSEVSDDPTHGNAKYGARMLAQIMDWADHAGHPSRTSSESA